MLYNLIKSIILSNEPNAFDDFFKFEFFFGKLFGTIIQYIVKVLTLNF